METAIEELLAELERSGADALAVLAARPADPDALAAPSRRFERARRLGLTGMWCFTPRGLAELRRQAAANGGGADLAEAVAAFEAAGGSVATHEVDGWWQYGGSGDELLEGNRIVLDALPRVSPPVAAIDAEVQGRVHVHPTALLEDVTIRGPVVIGARTHVSGAFIGPYTSIGDDVSITNAEIENSIVHSGARIAHVSRRLEGCVLGTGAHVFSDFALPKALRLRVGPDSEVGLA
jgi:glucose-1-phosphate thymidylyltransferase